MLRPARLQASTAPTPAVDVYSCPVLEVAPAVPRGAPSTTPEESPNVYWTTSTPPAPHLLSPGRLDLGQAHYRRSLGLACAKARYPLSLRQKALPHRMQRAQRQTFARMVTLQRCLQQELHAEVGLAQIPQPPRPTTASLIPSQDLYTVVAPSPAGVLRDSANTCFQQAGWNAPHLLCFPALLPLRLPLNRSALLHQAMAL